MQPQRFDLKYQAQGEGAQGDGYERPVMVHRAVLGSVERMFAILTEHYAGKWPFFLSPRQVMIVPVTKAYADYAQRVQSRIKHAGYYVDVDTTARTLNKMVREAQLAQLSTVHGLMLAYASLSQAVEAPTRPSDATRALTAGAMLAVFDCLLRLQPRRAITGVPLIQAHGSQSVALWRALAVPHALRRLRPLQRRCNGVVTASASPVEWFPTCVVSQLSVSAVVDGVIQVGVSAGVSKIVHVRAVVRVGAGVFVFVCVLLSSYKKSRISTYAKPFGRPVYLFTKIVTRSILPHDLK